ncbi:BQ2448_3236 [Microbotryum intermedium]|uniref:Folylpolyglutamate synthase n=1 Tax=Microbotryum intermedium TaxID=269621 RepID=A0A238FKF3_9BASI|nr:BQ2448_3236 [Microbotryum intermedium]
MRPYPSLHHLPSQRRTRTYALLKRSMWTRDRSYADAIDRLNSLQSNASVIEHIRKTGGKNGEAQMGETIEYLERIGYKPSDLNALNALHITGTKGKGSTSAFVDSILRHVEPSAKTGLYTSPHMVAVRERIRLNGQPLDEERFARYFFEVWDRLEGNKQKRKDPETTLEKPAYFRYLTLMAFHVFLQEKVDATILEVGVGGTYDSTNVVPQPIVTGVASLGIDHVFPRVPALAVQQPEEGLDVLVSRAKELGASSFTIVPEIEQLKTIPLGLAGAHQRINASLAVGLVRSFLASPRLPPAYSSSALAPSDATSLPASLIAPVPLPSSIVKGLEATRWPGRCQIERDAKSPAVTWHLDGAHTVESLQCCGEWFGEVALECSSHAEDRKRVLVFNCTSGRSGLSLLGTLVESLQTRSKDSPFHYVVFCTNATFSSGSSAGDLTSNAVDQKELESLTVQNELKDAWEELTRSPEGREVEAHVAEVHVLGSIEDAVLMIRGLEGSVDVLVTGSLHLVGGVMAVAELPL